MNNAWIAVASVLAFNSVMLGQETRPSSAPTSQPAAQVYSAWPYDAKEAARRQDETATRLGVQKELVLDLGTNVTLKLVLIPAGAFRMGSPDREPERMPNEGPLHPVTISRAYYMGVTEVTQAQYEAVMAMNPSAFKAPESPVESVSWKQRGRVLQAGFGENKEDGSTAYRGRVGTRRACGNGHRVFLPWQPERLCLVHREFGETNAPCGAEESQCIRAL